MSYLNFKYLFHILCLLVYILYAYFITPNPTIPILWFLYIYYLNRDYKQSYISFASTLILGLMIALHILVFDMIGYRAQAGYISLVILIIGLFQTLKSIKKPYITIALATLIRIILYIVLFTFIFYTLYYIRFGIRIDESVILAISQTDINEALEFLSGNFSSWWWLIPVSIVYISELIYRFFYKNITPTLLRCIYIEVLLSLIMILYTYGYMTLFSFITNTVDNYKDEVSRYHKLKNSHKKFNLRAYKKKRGETYIVVIGESLNKNHMSLYGYPRETTPHLRRLYDFGKLIRFENAFSPFANTVPVLTRALTMANQTNGIKYLNTPTIVELFKSAGFKTYWLTNQSLYGSWDTPISVIAHQSDELYSYNSFIGKRVNTVYPDGIMLSKLQEILDKETKENRVIFIHLMGNHFLYSHRYPFSFEKFKDDLPQAIFGKLAYQDFIRSFKDAIKHRVSWHEFYDRFFGGRVKRINSYDNSVFYNDFVVSKIITLLKHQSSVGALIYFSDHSEDVIHGFQHSKRAFRWSMTQIPLIVWLSDKYKVRYPLKTKALKSNIDKLFSNDRLYDTIAGIASIDTNTTDISNDLSSPKYRMEMQDAVLFDGELSYLDRRNVYFWQKSNAKWINDNNLTLKLFPHRINSSGKLWSIYEDGYRAMEMDLRYIESKKDIYIGHDLGDMGFSLAHYLSLKPLKEMKRVWFDFKNITSDNVDIILNKLDKLDSKYHLKSRIFIESHYRPILYKLHQRGWKSSLYIPTERIISLMKTNNPNILDKEAKKIALEVKKQSVDAVSFDFRLYPFVREYLKRYLDNNIEFYTWWGPELSSKEYRDLIIKNGYQDERLKIILSIYKSDYHL